MSNIAQAVNVLQAVILTEKDRMLVTPTGHVYEMYAPHQSGTAVRTTVETECVSFEKSGGAGSLPAVAGSASLKGKTLFLTLTNAHAEKTIGLSVDLLGGARAEGAKARILAKDIRGLNTFDKPDQVRPVDFPVKASGASLGLELPAASVMALELALS
jgi:alpha-N-arabinofuranosidase